MGVTNHPGFLRALADEGLTASEAIALTEWLRFAEKVLPGSSSSEASLKNLTAGEIIALRMAGVQSTPKESA